MDLTAAETIGAVLPGLAAGLTAGIMLAAAIFSLLVPALDRGSIAGA